MGVKAQFYIEQIPPAFALEFARADHYLHRDAPAELAFGLVSEADALVYGIVTYGTPSSAPLRSGIAGPEHANNVIELTRLWVDESVPKNGESFLIGNTVRRNTKEIVVSFADTAENHLGVVYQATNWLYTGLSAKRTDWVVDGEPSRHGQTWGDKYTATELRDKYGDRFRSVPRSRKHRYVFLNADRRRRGQLLADLKYPVLPYPKRVDTDHPYASVANTT